MFAAVYEFVSGVGWYAFILGMVLPFPIFSVIKTVLKIFGVYTIVREREARVYVLFGNVLGVIDEPGIHFLWSKIGAGAILVNILGQVHKVDMRLDQQYVRSQVVNSEEGTPMCIGLWYEMNIVDPIAYIFRNSAPRDSLAANVGSATVRCLSNLPLEVLMSDRHEMSQTVREEVSEKSKEWGYKLGSAYIRKVNFRDSNMIEQIQSKVASRLRQITSAIKQKGVNQVSVITNTAEHKAALDFGKAAAIRPQIVGKVLSEISKDAEVSEALFEILQLQKITGNNIPIRIVPEGANILIADSGIEKVGKAAVNPR